MTEESFDLILCVRQAENHTDVVSDPWEYISCYWGPQTQDLEIAVSVTVINCIIFVTGLLGNIVVCIVISKHPSLNSPTDYYLLNLAISDVTLLIFGLPYDVTLFWHQYPWQLGTKACQSRALISETASNVSVLTVVTFSTERYLAICHPLYKLAITSLQRARRIIITLWIISFACAMPFAICSDVHFLTYPENGTYQIPESAFCGMISQPENIPMTEISTVTFFILPMIVIIYQYIKMGIAIQQTAIDSFEKGSVHGRRKKGQQTNKTIVKMLSFVVLGFFLCWCPFHTQRLLSVYLKDYEFFDEMNYWMYITSGVFYYFSSTLNPILYNVMSDRMRNAFKEVICGVKRKGKKRMTWSRTTTKETSDVYISTHPGKTNEDLVHFFSSGQWKCGMMRRYHEMTLTTSFRGETTI